MNQFVLDWNMGDHNSRSSYTDLLATSNQKKPLGQDSDLIELLWCNGHVVMQSQTHRRSPRTEPAQKSAPALNASNVTQEDESAPWFPYSMDDSLEKDFFADFFYEMPAVDAVADKFVKDAPVEEEKRGEAGAGNEEKLMPPPESHATRSAQRTVSMEDDDVVELSCFSRPQKAFRMQIEAGESSMMTIGSSICGSNQVQTPAKPSRTMSGEAAGGAVLRERHGNVRRCGGKLPSVTANASSHEATVSSSSGRSNCSFGRTEPQSTSNRSSKRKGRDAEESESHSEEGDFESAEATKPVQRSTASRRSRAAEVHNLSERRRRDRINEKMKALQELIPHCNKTDKASMLDEAIEYLKSLQLQVQMMWMGSGMAPMMFPGVHQYMPRMGIGMSSPMPPMPSPVQLPRVPYMNQSIASNSTVNQSHMQAVNLPEPYAHYLGLNHLQRPSQNYLQAMNFYPFGAKTVQQNPAIIMPGSSLPATSATFSSENAQNNKSG